MAKGPYGGAEDWIALPLNQALFANLDQDAVVGHQTAIENGFINELGGHTRFPGLETFCDLPGDNGRVYLYDFAGDLLAATSAGNVFRVAQNGAVTNVTGTPVAGGRRVIFAKDNQAAYMAAGAQIIWLRSTKTEALTAPAGSNPQQYAQPPLSTHVASINGYVVAVAINSQLWYYSNPGYPQQWPPLNTESADSSPDNATALMISDFGDLMFGGLSAIEQWERVPSGNTPFYRRWSMGDGMKVPYAMLFADSATWTINRRNQFVRITGQIGRSESNDIQLILEKIDDWTDTWVGGFPNNPCHVIGQQFILMQMPNATNPYGTKGVTLLYDYRNKRWSMLYGWDQKAGVPTRWPGWSHWRLWDQVFVGGEGKIYKLTTSTYTNDGMLQRWLTRTSHIAEGNMVQIKDFRVQVVRGAGASGVVGASPPAANIRARCSRDGRPFGPWIQRDLGVAGDRIQFKNFGPWGTGTSFMWEIMCADDTPLNLIKAEVKAVKIGH